MNIGRQMQGLSLDQAPPLSLVASFFLTGPLFLAIAGAMIAFLGTGALMHPFSPQTLALTHLGTLGFLAMVMVGAIYQMLPVVIGTPVRGVLLARMVHLGLTIGIVAMVAGIGWSSPIVAGVGGSLVVGALTLFFFPAIDALRRAKAGTETSKAMFLALMSLLLLAFLGAMMVQGHSGGDFPGDRLLFIRAHLSVGFYGWVGALIMGVSWQVVPMFYLAEAIDERAKRATRYVLVLGIALPSLALLLPTSWAQLLSSYGATPAMVALFLVHPGLTLRSIARRKRKRVDGSLRCWQWALGLAPLAGLSGLLASFVDAPRWDVLFGLMAIWGWAGLILHGMLSRIVPFLVWWHRFSPLVGKVPIPSMKGLWPDRWTKRSMKAHLASLVLLTIGLALGESLVAEIALRLGGALMALTGLALVGYITKVLASKVPEIEEPLMDGFGASN